MLHRLKTIDKFNKDPFSTQDRILKDLISKGKLTNWGKANNLNSITSYSEYSKKISVNDYNSLKPYISLMMEGESNVLWPTPVKWFAKSSGTTEDKSKFIPVSPEALSACHYKGGRDMYSLYYRNNPNANLFDGRTFVLGGNHKVHSMTHGTAYGDLSAVLLQNIPSWYEYKRVPSLAIALMDNWEDKIEKLALSTMNHNVSNLLGVPTWTVVLFRKLFEITGKKNIADIWPNLELYIHGGVSFVPYQNLFRNLIRKNNMHYMETYNASEGLFSIQDDLTRDDMLLMLDYGIYYEFIPSDKINEPNPERFAIPLEDVKKNVNYVMIITTNSGLWRYNIGDTIKFSDLRPYRIQLSGRTKHYINAFGEELIVENADKAIAHASEKTGSIVSDYTAAPVYFSAEGNGAHEWLIEFEKEPENLQTFTEFLDEGLKNQNSDYEAKRFKNIALRFPKLIKLKPGTFYKWMKSRGKLGGQNKVPRLSNNREFVDGLIDFEAGT